jgi:plasmid stability protein
MRTMIQIRNVPAELHRRAKARAALEGMTLSDFAKEALRRALEQPTIGEISARIRQLPPVETSPSAAELVRAERDSR